MEPYTKEWLQEICLNSYSYAEVLKKAGRSSGSAIQTLNRAGTARINACGDSRLRGLGSRKPIGFRQWVVHLDHIDGDNSNNEICNLRYLCPNCHAMTETYRGKNKALKNKCVESIHQLPKS